MNVLFYDENSSLEKSARSEIANFLSIHLEQYGDPIEMIEKSIDYALKKDAAAGGFLAVGYDGTQMVGAAVMNRTRMEDYIPENILVYLAVHKEYRGKGVGRELMVKCLDRVEGNVALHVEPENPAFFLYKSLGFENKYLEMRLNRGGEI